MRRGRKSKERFKSFEERIEDLKKEIELLEELIPIYDYFKLTTRYQNSYIVEVRKIVTKELLAKGVSYSEIGRALSRNHASIINLMLLENNSTVKEEVSLNYKKWIADKMCPITYTVLINSAIHKTGWASTTAYKLKQL